MRSAPAGMTRSVLRTRLRFVARALSKSPRAAWLCGDWREAEAEACTARFWAQRNTTAAASGRGDAR